MHMLLAWPYNIRAVLAAAILVNIDYDGSLNIICAAMGPAAASRTTTAGGVWPPVGYTVGRLLPCLHVIDRLRLNDVL